MKEVNVAKFGGACAVLAGIFTLMAGVLYFLLPSEQRLGVPGKTLLAFFAQQPTLLTFENLALALVGVFGLGLVPALAQKVESQNAGWVRWTSTLAFVGYAVSAVGSFIFVGRLPVVAAAYAAGDSSTQAALAALWRTTLDPLGLWGYGAIGLWILVASLSARQMASFSKPLAYLGVLAGILHWLAPLAFLAATPSLFFVVAGPGGIVAAVWYVWTGMSLRRVD